VAKIKFSQLAYLDLEQLGDYISENLHSPIAARNTVNRIQTAIDMLIDYPEFGAPLSSRNNIADGYRFLVCGSYLAFYRFVDDCVYIDRILYGRRDYMRILFGNILDKDADDVDQTK